MSTINTIQSTTLSVELKIKEMQETYNVLEEHRIQVSILEMFSSEMKRENGEVDGGAFSWNHTWSIERCPVAQLNSPLMKNVTQDVSYFLLYFDFSSHIFPLPLLNAKLIFSVFISNLFLFSLLVIFLKKNSSTQSFLTAICWWRFIWKSDGRSYSARLFIAQKRCTRQKWNSRKWQRTISKSLSRR